MVPLNCAWRCSMSSSSASTARTRFSVVTCATRGRQALEEIEVAGNRPGVEHGEQELGVGDVELVEVRELAHLMADHQLQVPERLQHGVDEALFVPADGGSEQNHQVDIGMQAQRPAAVAAERADHERSAVSGCAASPRAAVTTPSMRRGIARLRLAAAAALPRLERELAARGRQRRRHLRPAQRGRPPPPAASSRATRVISSVPIHSPSPHAARVFEWLHPAPRSAGPGRHEWPDRPPAADQ